MKTKLLATVAGICAASLTTALGITSTTSFGPMSGETFGGSGIPNDAVETTTITIPGAAGAGSTVITEGLSATPRFQPGELGNNTAGTFTVSAGTQWNFDFVASIAGGGTLGDFSFRLYYDLDPAAGTPLSSLGVWNLNAGQNPASTSVHNSEFMGFGFLANGVAGAVTPPSGGFTYNINAPGEYTFALGTYDANGNQVGDLDTIHVDVASVPDTTSTAGLLVVSAFGLFFMKKHMAKRGAGAKA